MIIFKVKSKLDRVKRIKNPFVDIYDPNYRAVFEPGKVEVVEQNFYNFLKSYPTMFDFEEESVEDVGLRVVALENNLEDVGLRFIALENRMSEVDAILAEIRVKETPKRTYNKKVKLESKQIVVPGKDVVLDTEKVKSESKKLVVAGQEVDPDITVL